MKVLVACEESQRVCIEFRKIGHEAYSCDIEPCSGGHPEWHIQGDVLPLLNGNCDFKTVNGDLHHLTGKWDMIIAFPPCTHLAVSGARHFKKKRADGRQLKAIQFFSEFLKADCVKIGIENPVNIIGSDYIKEWFPEYSYMPKCAQYIQPYEYGEKARKKTGLWLKGLPKLIPTKIVQPELVEYTRANGKKTTFSKGFCSGFKKEERSKVRSKTYLGIAKAMAEQWGKEFIE